MKEAWDYFTKSARIHFAKLIRALSKEHPQLRADIKSLKYHDYCARLLYIINMYAYEGNKSGEFDLAWAMLIAKPLSANQARQSVRDLIELGLMTEMEDEVDEEPKKSNEPTRNTPPKSGGNINPETRFDFD